MGPLDMVTIPPFLTPGAAAKEAGLFKPLDPEKAKKFENAKAALQQALKTAKEAPNEINRQRKAMAAEKIKRIKEQLKTLKQMPGADPKMIARMAARLARDLAQALKEYASAGATGSEVQAAGGGGAGASAPVSSAQASDESAVSENADGIKAYASAQGLVDDSGFPVDKSSDPEMVWKKDDDSEFMNEAKRLMDELRNIIKMQRIRSGPKERFKRDDVADAEKAMQDMERAFQSAQRALSATNIRI